MQKRDDAKQKNAISKKNFIRNNNTITTSLFQSLKDTDKH